MEHFEFLDNRDEKLILSEIEAGNKDALHGLMIVNVDDFLLIRQKYGNEYGDEILTQLMGLLKKTFRGTDIIVPLKGDEFVIFIGNVRDIYSLELLGAKLHSAINSLKLKDNDFLTASIGMSVYPIHGKTYSELKDKSYQAMLQVKRSGKNAYRLYDSAKTKALFFYYMFNRTDFEKKAKDNEFFFFDIGERYRDICTAMFRLHEDSVSALQSIMELSCLYLGYSRVYINTVCELSEAEKRKLRYANPGCEFLPESNTLKIILADLHARLREQFKTISIIDVDDETVDEEIRLTLKEQGVIQLLYFPIYSGNEFQTACIFENLTGEKIDISIEELSKLGEQFLSVFSYFNTSYARENAIRLDMFQNIDACVYIVDADSHRIEFANKKALSYGDSSCIGELCHKALCNSDKVCETCPLGSMDRNDPGATGVSDNYNYMARQWNRKIFSWMDVNENKNKAVIIGVDISDYINS